MGAATEWWSELVEVPAEGFQKPVIKRRNPKTVRKNLVDGYRGCPQISVTKSADLCRRIEGRAFGAMLGQEVAPACLMARSDEAIKEMSARRHRSGQPAPRRKIRTNVLPGEDSNLR